MFAFTRCFLPVAAKPFGAISLGHRAGILSFSLARTHPQFHIQKKGAEKQRV
jgi:hypothetical protein